jgi:Peptidase family M23
MPHRLLAAAVTLAAVLVSAPAARADWVWPVQGEVITPYRNGDDPYAGGQHRGIDIAAAIGTPVVAAAGGQVRFAGTAGSSGLTVSIRTVDGLFDTSYLHLSSTAVHKGDQVSAGDRLGAVGMTGKRSAAAPHLHFGVRDAGTRHGYHDPLAFLPPSPFPAERPRPAPSPNPAPAPLTPPPEPAPAPDPRPRASLPSPREAPSPRPRPIPHRAPRRHPAPGRAPDRDRLRVPLPAPRPTPVAAARGIPHKRPAPHGAPRGAPVAEAVPDSPASSATGRTAPAAARPASGPDLGYALACAGLLLAAALLGLSEDGRKSTRRGRDRVARALRPLVGRR